MRKVRKGHGILDVFPKSIDFWDTSKNKENINDVSFGSAIKAWWKCSRGHSFQQQVAYFVANGGSCPKCNKRSRISLREIRVYCEVKYFFGDAVLDYLFRPKLRVDVYVPSVRTVIEYDGSYWHRSREAKDKEKNKLLFDAGVRVIRIREKPLEKLFDDDILCNLKDIFLSCREIIAKLGKDVSGYDTFKNDILYEKIISDILSGTVLNNFKERCSGLCDEWDKDKNSIGPESVSYGSGMCVWWKCAKGHSWKTSVCNRSLRKSGCPKCSKCQVGVSNNLVATYPRIAAEWDFDKNDLAPKDVSKTYHEKVWWRCSVCNRSWSQPVFSRVKYRNRKYNGCPACKRRRKLKERSLLVEKPELVKEWDFDKNTLLPEDVFSSENIMIWWKCEKGHSWKAHLYMRSWRKTTCPHCRGSK